MKNVVLYVLLLLVAIMSGCVATPSIVMESGFQRKVITPCDNDLFCFRKTYDVAWDTACIEDNPRYRSNCNQYRRWQQNSYPISYRGSESVIETGSYGYAITLPAGGSVRMLSDDK